MNPILHAFFGWLLRASCQAAIITLLVLLAQICLRKHLDARWRHLLWLLVLARLAMPVSLPSPTSLFNYVRVEPAAPETSAPLPQPAPLTPAASTEPETIVVPSGTTSIISVQQTPPAARWAMPDWPPVLAFIWTLGVIVLIVRTGIQNILFCRRLRHGRPVDDPQTLEIFEDCKSLMGVRAAVGLTETGAVNSPALYGLFRLRLLLPARLVAGFSASELRHILLHELAHVRRRDMTVQWLVMLFQIAHWFNPVLWFGFRRAGVDRELACDELALSVVGEGEGRDYGRTIVKLLEACAQAPALPGLVGILEDKAQMFQRISMIARFKRHSRWSLAGAAAAAVLAVATLTGAQPGKVPESGTPVMSPEIDRKVASIVQDWESSPGVFDDVEIYAGQIQELVQIGKPAVPALTAALDRTTRDTPMRLLAFTLRAIGDPRAVPALIRAIPKTLLPPGSDCGVSVSNQGLLKFMRSNDLDGGTGTAGCFGMGRPVREVCGALGKITGTHQDEAEIFSTFLEGGGQQRIMERKAYYEVAQRWAEWWKANWRRFVDDRALADVRLPALPALRAEAAPMNFLTGTNVTTSGGMGGMIVGAMEESWQNCCLTLSLSRLSGLPKQLAGNGAGTSVEIVIVRAAKAGVDLLGTEYHDPQSGKSYYCLRGVGLRAWEVPNEHWDTIDQEVQRGALPALDTPAGDLLMHYDAAQSRYVPDRKATFLFITRDGIQGILRVTAQVTRKPTSQDMGIPFVPSDDSNPNQTQDFGSYPGVKLDYMFFYQETPEMKAEAKARQEANSAWAEERQTRKAAALLEKYPHLTGKVNLPGGGPASNAAVLVGGRSAILGDRRFEAEDQSTIVHTLSDGSFVLPQIPGAHALYVAHEDGFTEVNIDADKGSLPLTMTLAPWGRIEGIVTIEGKPVPHQKMGLLEGYGAGFMDDGLSLSPGTFITESDDNGRFVFTNVPPGDFQVCRMVHDTYEEAQYVNVTAGNTVVFEHGFNGRMIKGHLISPDSSTNFDWNGVQGLRFSTKLPPIEPPPGQDNQTWMQKYLQSPEGEARQRAAHSFAVVIERNGDFRIDDVPPGTYELQGELRADDGNPFGFGGKILGHLNQDVIVPEPPPGRQNEPLALGNMVIN